MKVLNKIVILFLFTFLVIIFLIKQAVESHSFASIIQEQLIYQKIDKEKMVVTFDHLDISLFPLRTTMVNLHIQLPEENVEGLFGSASFSVNLSDLFLNKFTISEAKIDGGELAILGKEQQAKKSKGKESQVVIVGNILAYIDQMVEDLPFEVSIISLNSLKLKTQHFAGTLNTMVFSYSTPQKKINIHLEGEKIIPRIGKKQTKGIDRLTLFAQADRKEIIVRDVTLGVGTNNISTRGVFNTGEGSYSGTIKAKISFQDMKNHIPNGYLDFIQDGYLNFNGNLRIKDSFFLNGGIDIENFHSSHGSFEKMTSMLSFSDNILGLEGTTITTLNGDILINKKVNFNMKDKTHNLTQIPVVLEGVKTGEILAFLGDKLKPLDSFLHGKLIFDLTKDGMTFNLEDNFLLENPKLIFNDLTVLSFNQLALSNTQFQHKFENNVFSLASNILLGKSILMAQGYIGGGRVDIGFQRGDVNFNIMEHIAGIKTGGGARINFKIRGPLDDAKIYAKGTAKDLFVDKYPIGDSRLDLTYSIKSKVLQVNLLEAISSDQSFSSKGHFCFCNDEENNMDIEIDVRRMSYLFVKRIIDIHLPRLAKDIKGLNFLSSGKVLLQVNFKKGINQIRTNFDLQSITYFDEVASSAKIDLLVNKEGISLNHLHIKKGQGSINGKYRYQKLRKHFEYDFRTRGIPLNSFSLYRERNMGLKGTINAFIRGSGSAQNNTTYARLELDNATIGSMRIPSPILTAVGSGKDFSVSWNFLGDKIKGSSELKMGRGEDISSLELNLAVDDIKPLFIAVSEHNVNSSIEGALYADLNASFPVSNPWVLDLNFDLERFFIQYGKDSMNLSNRERIDIVKGEIKQWDIRLDKGDNSFSTHASGALNNKFRVSNKYSFNPGVLKMLFREIANAEGSIEGETLFLGDNKEVDIKSKILGRDISLSHQMIPSILEDVHFDINAEKGSFFIKSIKGQYGRGDFSTAGEIVLGFPHPEINLQAEFRNINHSILSKSNLIASGEISMEGKDPPYLLNGKVIIDKILFVDNIEELTKEVTISHASSKYLPKRNLDSSEDILNFDIDIIGSNSIEVKTGIIDAVLSSTLSLGGSSSYPLLVGNASISPDVSKISFKGQEFSLRSGRVDFRDLKSKQPPLVQVEGSSTIDRYRVFLSILGNVDNLKLNLRSNPSLSQQDILSLITFGYTSEVSSNLDEEQKTFLTTMSLGSFLIDQLQIGRDLSGNLGLRLSVAPEFDDSEDELIENRASGTDSGVRKLKSSTKLKLESDVGEKTNVSLSSSLGTENEQSQELKVDYNINDNLSVQGVYENIIRANETEQINSLGGDVKFKWIFGD